MGGHVVRALQSVAILGGVFGDQIFEEVAKVESNVGIGIFLNDERRGGVLDEDGEQAVSGSLPGEPLIDGPRKRVEPFAAGRNG